MYYHSNDCGIFQKVMAEEMEIIGCQLRGYNTIHNGHRRKCIYYCMYYVLNIKVYIGLKGRLFAILRISMITAWRSEGLKSCLKRH